MMTKKLTLADVPRNSPESQKENSSFQFQKHQLIENGILEKNIEEEEIEDDTLIYSRPVFTRLLKKLKSGDLLMVTKIDRCCKNRMEFLQLQEKLKNRKRFRWPQKQPGNTKVEKP
jgi:DNA invertase Pin-like site-specific DNA recombinase